MPISILRLDMRAPAFSPVSPRDLYRAALDMAAYADRSGFQLVTLSEHHGTEDGYLPSPLVMAGLVAGRTEKIGITLMALLAPLHDPVELAEDIAVLDLASGGRVSVCAGMGYRPEEYAAAGKEWSQRGTLLDRAIETMLAAWSDQPVLHNGVKIDVTPKPFTRPHPNLWVGGGSKPAARRAARFGLPFAPQNDSQELVDLYESECRRLGVEGGYVLRPGAGRMTFVSEDPERTWREVGPHMLHDARSYASWQRPDVASAVTSGAETVEALREEGRYQVLTPEACVEQLRAAGPFEAVIHFPLVGGAPPEHGWKSLELYVERVLPAL